MRFQLWIACLGAGLFATSSIAAQESLPEQLQVPQCLAKHITFSHEVLAENNQFKIIELDSKQVDKLSHLADTIQCGRFVNVSHKLAGLPIAKQKYALTLLKKNSNKPKNDKYEIKHQEEVNATIKEVVSDNIWQTLTQMTSFYNRSASKETGVETAKWLKKSFEDMASQYGRTDTNTFFVKTGRYQQPSLVTVIGKDIKAPAVVIGAHMDTLDGRMPGAGDDGSGSSSVMEVARVLMSSPLQFKRPIYIIWYAAEERGLVGSQYVVEHFMNQKIPVKAAIQFDMTGYRVTKDDPTMWVYTDYTNKSLSNYISKLIETYVHVPVDYSSCGYGCSDHASWDAEGIPAAFPCESNFEDHNPYIHSSYDTMEKLSLEHMTNFSKLGIAFAIELASE